MKQLISAIAVACMWASIITTTGCNGTTVAQDIVAWAPTIQSTAATVAATVSTLLPADALIVAAALAGFDGASNLVVAEAKAYLANPGASTLQLLQAAVLAFEQQINASLLSAARIVNTTSQQLVIAALSAVGTAINAIIALIQTIKGNTIGAAAVTVTTKLSSVRQLRTDKADIALLAAHYGVTPSQAAPVYYAQMGDLQTAGF
jgi:hypothetical protein